MIDIKAIKQEMEAKNPLILNLTNYVTMDFIANTLLALGASPVMSHEESDALALAHIASAITLNIGTLDHSFNTIAFAVAQNNNNKPLILDPVGSGASTIRTETALRLLPFATTLRGNASEIQSLSKASSTTKGVDSSIESHDALSYANTLALQNNIIVAISGVDDYVIDSQNHYVCPFGHPFMTKITGMGCVLTSVVAAFQCVVSDPLKATYYAHLYFGLCGELAYQKSDSLGFYKNHFIDMIHNPDFDYMHKKLKQLPLKESL